MFLKVDYPIKFNYSVIKKLNNPKDYESINGKYLILQRVFKEKKPVSIKIENPCSDQMKKSQRTLSKSFAISPKTTSNC